MDEWLDYLEDRGVDQHLAQSYFNYGCNLVDSGNPVIMELEHLARIVGIKLSILSSMIAQPESFYRSFRIKKRRGGMREISAPYPSLLSCQRWIYENILASKPVHPCAHGFVRGRSIVSNASCHLGKQMLLKMDIRGFFPSIPFAWVIKYFNSLGYAKNVSYYLASLCCLNRCLGQGAATSPALANILVYHLDVRLDALSKKCKITYTRYADDLAFSGESIPLWFSETVSQIVRNFGLQINTDKTQLHQKSGKRVLTGISVAGSCLKLPREATRLLRKEIYFVRKFGILSHVINQKIRNPFYLQSLIGKFGFWLQIEPDNEFAKQAFDDLINMAALRM